MTIHQTDRDAAELALAVREMFRTSRELFDNANGDCGAVMQAIRWEQRAIDTIREAERARIVAAARKYADEYQSPIYSDALRQFAAAIERGEI